LTAPSSWVIADPVAGRPLGSGVARMTLENRNKAGRRRRLFQRVALAWSVALLSAIPTPSPAETTAKDIMVAVRTFGFVVHPPTGEVLLAVVFDPTRPQSASDLQTVISVLDGGAHVGGMTVQPVPIPVTELNRLVGFRFVLLIGDVQNYRQAIFERTRGQGIVTISTDLDCVRAGLCVMGVAAEPRVQVLVNRAASDAAAVEFMLAFRMMITEL